MIKSNRAELMVMSIAFSVLTGCSSIKNHFPDKEQDYQFSTEIAPLTIPSDLRNNELKPLFIAPEKNQDEEVVVMGEMVDSEAAITNPLPIVKSSNTTLPTEEVIIKRGPTQVDFVMFDGGATRLRINENFTPSWRLVAKALSRNRIEIISRNKSSGELVVQYDPNETDYQDETVWDELLFIFAEDHSQEKEYRVKVMEHKNNTEVIVLDAENTPLSDGVGLHLLKLLFSTIHTELTAKK